MLIALHDRQDEVLPKQTRRREAGRSTLATIAADAGVSVATVSKVVNGRGDVAPETRALVEVLLTRHDYASPSARRGSPPGFTVEFLVDGDFTSHTTRVVDGVVQAAGEHGVSIVLGQLRDRVRSRSASAPRPWAPALHDAGRAGVIVVNGDLTGAHVAALDHAGLPLVVIDPLNLPRSGVVSVGSTNFTGGLSATRHLISLGHRRIAFAGGPATSSGNQARLHGYRAAMETAGLTPDPELVSNGSFHYDSGRRAGARLLQLREPPTAVFGGCDAIALGIVEAARVLGVRVPDDLGVVGFDDTEAASTSAPALTTIRQPLREMGRVAVTTVLRLADGAYLDSHHVELATELVVRGSTAPPRA